MSSLYGMKPEPMALQEQRAMALLVISKQILSRVDITPFRGPVLSSNQLETWFPGLEPKGSVSLIFSWDPSSEQLIVDLEDSGRNGYLEIDVQPMPAEELALLATGKGLNPALGNGSNRRRSVS